MDNVDPILDGRNDASRDVRIRCRLNKEFILLCGISDIEREKRVEWQPLKRQEPRDRG